MRTNIREVTRLSKAFSNLLRYIDKLPLTQKEQVYQWVKRYVQPSSSVGGRLINEMRETRFKEGFECPHCSSEHIVRIGKYNGRQRYRCKCCNKTFTDTTNTVLYRTRKETNGLHLLIVVQRLFPTKICGNCRGYLGYSFLLETQTVKCIETNGF